MKTVIAWLALLPASPFGTIVCEAMLHVPAPAWLQLVNLAASAALLGLAWLLPAMKPIRGYLASITLLVLGGLIVVQVESAPAWAERFERGPSWRFVLADSMLEIVPCLLLALSLAGSGLSRRDVFLVRGDLRARFAMPCKRSVGSWGWWGPFLTLFLAIPLLLQLVSTTRPDLLLLPRALHGLPLSLAFAAFNGAQEEFRFRAVLLGRLAPALGGAQALAITSVLFGLGHWHGHPSGPVGMVMAAFAGFVWGKSMLDTKGFAWAWLIHGFQDLLIFTLLLTSGR